MSTGKSNKGQKSESKKREFVRLVGLNLEVEVCIISRSKDGKTMEVSLKTGKDQRPETRHLSKNGENWIGAIPNVTYVSPTLAAQIAKACITAGYKYSRTNGSQQIVGDKIVTLLCEYDVNFSN